MVGKDYNSWPLFTDLFPTFFPGVKTSRDKLLIDFDKEVLIKRMESFFDPDISYKEWCEQNPGLAEKTNRFHPESVRDYLVRRASNQKILFATNTDPSMFVGSTGSLKPSFSTKNDLNISHSLGLAMSG